MVKARRSKKTPKKYCSFRREFKGNDEVQKTMKKYMEHDNMFYGNSLKNYNDYFLSSLDEKEYHKQAQRVCPSGSLIRKFPKLDKKKINALLKESVDRFLRTQDFVDFMAAVAHENEYERSFLEGMNFSYKAFREWCKVTAANMSPIQQYQYYHRNIAKLKALIKQFKLSRAVERTVVNSKMYPEQRKFPAETRKYIERFWVTIPKKRRSYKTNPKPNPKKRSSSKERSRSRSRSPSRSQSRSRSQSPRRSQSPSRSQSRNLSQSRSRSQGRNLSEIRSQSQSPNRSQSRNLSQIRSRSQGRQLRSGMSQIRSIHDTNFRGFPSTIYDDTRGTLAALKTFISPKKNAPKKRTSKRAPKKGKSKNG